MATPRPTALLLIAHGSRRAEANADLDWLAEEFRALGRYDCVKTAYLELVEPTILQGGIACAESGATRVVMVPYFLSAGVHVREDLAEVQAELANAYPHIEFQLAEPLGRHPLLIEIVDQRIEAVCGR